MGLIKRVNSILVAQLNEIIDAFENPERMSKQAIREMEAAVQAAMESTARAIAGERRLEQELADYRAKAQASRDRAIELVQRGDDAAARGALARQFEYDALAESVAEPRARCAETSARLRQQLDAMRRRLAEAKRHRAALAARQRSAEALRQFVKTLGHLRSDVEAFARFDEMWRRAAERESESEAIAELCLERTLERDGPRKIESELESLKRWAAESVVRTAPGPSGSS